MAFISGNLTIDEAVTNHGTNQDDVDYATWAASHGSIVARLNANSPATQTGFPQVAERTDMIDCSTASGLALSVTGGGVTSFTDLAGNSITLEADSVNPNIILGKAAGVTAFAVILDHVDAGNTITSANVYIVMFEALYNPIATQIDSADTLDVAGLISLDVTTTTFETQFLPLNFAAIPSGSPQETLTVPTTSTTDNHTILFNGIVFPSGAVADPTTLPVNSGTNDDLNPDAIGFGVKGGQASQMNQNEGFFAQDAAWTTGNDAEINGLRFDIQGVGGTKSVNVEYWLVDDGAVVAGSHAIQTVNLPGGSAVYENFTIHSDESFDQVYVRFTYDTKVDTSGVRVENFEIELANTIQTDITTHEDLGAHIIFQDDGISLGAQSDSAVAFTAGATTGDVALTNLSTGVDVPAEVYLSSVPTGWTFDVPGDTTPNAATDPTGTFQIVVDNDSYAFNVLKNPVLTFQPLNFAAIPSGSPQETLSVPTSSASDTHEITFNGVLFPSGAVADPTTIPTDSGTNDDLNPDAVGFGVKGGQASQMNQNEGFFAQDSAWSAINDVEINGLRFDIQGIGGVKSVNVEYWLVDDGAVVAGSHAIQAVTLPKGNAVYENFTIHSDTSFDQVYVRFNYNTNPDTSGVRVENFEIQLADPVPDQEFTFGITALDRDLEPSLEATFKVGVDGNGDGSVIVV